MKSIKNLLATLAFVFAFGAAFALDTNNDTTVFKYGSFSSGCDLGTLNESNCATIFTLEGVCTVTSGSQTVTAHDQAGCSSTLYKQPI